MSRTAPRLAPGAAALATLLLAGAASATPVGELRLPPGFRAELVYEVPLDSQGSWVSLAVDQQGRIIASAQYGALYRVKPSPLGGKPAETVVEEVPMTIGMAQGLLDVDGKLYVVMNGRLGAFASGLYRLTDSADDEDDRYDRLEQLRVFQGDGEHGPHAVVLGPDGKSLYIICGNYTGLPLYDRTLVPPKWGEDQLLPRLGDPLGHANEIRAPGGWVARMDLEGKNLELVSVGYRNAYDIAFNADGELFTFDSDMEWDIGTPWYRPTRVCHVTSGSDFGWRGGNSPWPPYYPDTLPTVVDVGPGSPTGLAFGAGTKFPPRYQQALFAGDWSYGNIFAIHLTPDGSSYRGEVERFASAMPLGVTDMVVRPQDGCLYFAVGGRNSESGLYRIIAIPDAEQPPATTSQPTVVATPPAEAAELRQARHAIEQLHIAPQPGALDEAWPRLSDPDRFIRYAARVAVEHQDVGEWTDRALAETNPEAHITALVALARSAQSDVSDRWAESLTAISWDSIDRAQRLELIRAAALGVMRFDPLPDPVRQQIVAAFDARYPTGDYLIDRELANLLLRLRATNMVERLLAVLANAATSEEAIDAAITLSAATEGWTMPQREQLMDWFDRAATRGGGRSYFGYIVSARDRFIRNLPLEDRAALQERIRKPLVENSPAVEVVTRPFVREWTLDELVAAAEADQLPRDLQNGRRMFSAATCYNCHRVAGEGSSVGPDLTGVGGRFGVRDILRSIVEPNYAISDQYQQMVFDTNGRTIVGRVTNLSESVVLVSTDMLDPKKEISIRRDEIDDQYPSEVSIMPAGLLNTLSESEVLDLVAFLRNGGAGAAERAGATAPPGSSDSPSPAAAP